MLDDMRISDSNVLTFRAIEVVDLAMIHRWLNEPCVLKWYARRPFSPSEVAGKYIPRIEGSVPVRVFVVEVDGVPVGLIQTYRLADFLDYAALVRARLGWAGVDFFVGEPEYRGHGLGARLIDLFVRKVVFGAWKADACVSGPAPSNVASIRALQRAGFKHLRTIAVLNGEIEHVMARSRKRAA